MRLIGVEAAGEGMETGRHAAAINGGRPGVLHGNMTYLLQDDEGQITEAHSISAGLDYPGIGPEHSWLHDVGRASYLTATDMESLDAFKLCAELEGILPAIESAHALARLGDVVKDVGKDGIVVLNLSGRGDKGRGDGRRPPGAHDLTTSRIDARFAALKPKAAPRSSPTSWRAIPTTRRA